MDKSKKGAVLVLALLVMFVGAIILGGLFMYLDTSLLLATRGEENAVSYYAADSGIEDAILWLQHEPWLPHEEPLAGWNVSCNPRNPPDQPCSNSYVIGSTTVDVSVVNPQSEGFGNDTFQINSTATADSGARTEITSYIQMAQLDFYRYGEDAVTTNCSAIIRGQQSAVNGNVTYVCWLDCGGGDLCPDDGEDCCMDTVNGTVRQDNTPPPGIDWWPETWAIAQYFEDQAENKDAVHMTGDVEIDVADLSYEISEPPYNGNLESLGPLYVDGDLDIYSDVDGANASLAGVVYVTGDLTIGGAKAFSLNLSDQVIFVENEGATIGDLPIKPANAEVSIEGGDHSGCTFTGSGAIFAIGDIWFQPNMSTSPQDFTFIMALEGWVHIQPNGDFYGSIAGQDVDLWPNLYIERTDSRDLWDTLPDIDVNMMKIITYDIIDQ